MIEKINKNKKNKQCGSFSNENNTSMNNQQHWNHKKNSFNELFRSYIIAPTTPIKALKLKPETQSTVINKEH
jgi:hypothetical protein